MNLTYCGNYPHLDHAACPSSVECAAVTLAEALAPVECRSGSHAWYAGRCDRCGVSA
jgi:hypothetical protein